MIDSQNDNGEAFINLLGKLKGRCPLYCSLGNHEQIVRGIIGTDRFNHYAKQLHEAREILLDAIMLF